MEKSDILRSVPVSTEERLLLQMKLSQMFIITLIAHFVLYFSIVIIFCILPRIFIIYLKNKLFPKTKEAPVRKKSSLWDRVLLPPDELTLESSVENSNKRKKTKKSRDHHSKGEKHVGISRSTREHKNKGTSTEEKQTNPDSSIASISKMRKGSHATDEKQADPSRSLIEHKDKEAATDEKQNNPDSSGKKTNELKSTDEKRVNPSRSLIVRKDVASNENDHNNPDSSRVSIAKSMKGTRATDEKQVDPSRSSVLRKDNETLIEQGQNKTDSYKASIGKNWEARYLTAEKQADLLRLFLQRNKNRKPPEEKQVNYKSNAAFIEKPEEKQSICNASKVSLKKAELRKPLPKVGYLRHPEVKKPQKTGNKASPKKYVDVGTYACLDPESSSDDSDFVFLDH